MVCLPSYLRELEDFVLDDYGNPISFYRRWATSEMIGAEILGTWEFLSSTLTLQINLNGLERHVDEHEKDHARGHNEEEARRRDSLRKYWVLEQLVKYSPSYN